VGAAGVWMIEQLTMDRKRSDTRGEGKARNRSYRYEIKKNGVPRASKLRNALNLLAAMGDRSSKCRILLNKEMTCGCKENQSSGSLAANTESL
jgi:hypothetical protein